MYLSAYGMQLDMVQLAPQQKSLQLTLYRPVCFEDGIVLFFTALKSYVNLAKHLLESCSKHCGIASPAVIVKYG